jgi:hypothetical protein
VSSDLTYSSAQPALLLLWKLYRPVQHHSLNRAACHHGDHMLVHVGSMADKRSRPIIPSSVHTYVTTGCYSIHVLYVTSLLQTRYRLATYSAFSILFSTAQSKYSTTRNTAAIAGNCQQPTATWYMFLAGETLLGRLPSDRLDSWNDVTTHIHLQRLSCTSSHLSFPLRGCLQAQHIPFKLLISLLFNCTFSFGGHV